jgi:putative phosphoesterase
LTSIGLISDTHHHLDENIFKHFKDCDEIWHAGDFGTVEIADQLKTKKPLRGVYGNIDGYDVRSVYPEKLRFNCEEVSVFMTHIGGHPGRYAPGIKAELSSQPAMLFISGHSHILRVVFDEKLQTLHMNPGAAGKQGWHSMRTIIRFTIDKKEIGNCEVIELGKR